jgi:putative ABC transport system ATP-binding protein
LARRIVDDVSYSFGSGRFYSIIGPSGAGKSSLLRLLNRLDESSDGWVRFKGRDMRELPPCRLRQSVGYLFQTPYLFEATVRDNLLYAQPELSAMEIDQLIRQMQLPSAIVDSAVDDLSVGEKQRVALARLLAMTPEVVLLDEPTSALDPANTEAIERLIREAVAGRGLTVIMVSHSPRQVLRLGGEAMLMVDGRLVEHGDAVRLVQNPESPEGRRYMNGEPS